MATVGRKEILTEELAKRICRMIERMPDAGTPMSWQNVMTLVGKRFGRRFSRQMLSQKTWGNRKLIAEAFTEAKKVRRRMLADSAPKYGTAARSVLQERIAVLEARNMALQEELEQVRAQQIVSLDAFLNTRLDLRKLMQKALEEQ